MLTKKRIQTMIKSLATAYLITGILLLFTALVLFAAQPKESLVSAGILAIYVLSTFFGGLLAGKGIGSRKFIWGMATGALYFLVLLAASWAYSRTGRAGAGELVTTLLLCLGGGMLGGMLA